MVITSKYSSITAQPEYDVEFWNLMRNKPSTSNAISNGMEDATGTYRLPSNSHDKVSDIIRKESVFRNIATCINAYKGGFSILAKNCKDRAEFVAEGEEIPIYEGIDDFNSLEIGHYKLASIVKLDDAFVKDSGFDIEKYLSEKIGKSFARAEDSAFICGTGIDEPTGILHNTNGAEIGLETESLTYDDIISLYFSVDSEYRKNSVWLMNDRTALVLKKLKDSDGNYLWNSNSDTILGKPVLISNYMPDIGSGSKPVAFGDISYYWIVDRSPISVRTLIEKFALYGQIGYLAIEFLDGKLVRSDAVKVIKLVNPTETE